MILSLSSWNAEESFSGRLSHDKIFYATAMFCFGQLCEIRYFFHTQSHQSWFLSIDTLIIVFTYLAPYRTVSYRFVSYRIILHCVVFHFQMLFFWKNHSILLLTGKFFPWKCGKHSRWGRKTFPLASNHSVRYTCLYIFFSIISFQLWSGKRSSKYYKRPTGWDESVESAPGAQRRH